MAREAGLHIPYWGEEEDPKKDPPRWTMVGPLPPLLKAFEALVRADERALAAPVQEPVAWKWHQAPVKTSWGHDMVVADLAIDKDNTVSVYCERDQTTKVEAMFSPPSAPVQEPVAYLCENAVGHKYFRWKKPSSEYKPIALYTTSPAAQRQWVGLTVEEMNEMT
jgi:hypothetical protein